MIVESGMEGDEFARNIFPFLFLVSRLTFWRRSNISDFVVAKQSLYWIICDR